MAADYLTDVTDGFCSAECCFIESPIEQLRLVGHMMEITIFVDARKYVR